ncbi:NADH-quinone oxidoreductase subunit NuoN [Azovibrio restrictus]|uniref:NADH-quinone oxidoreductase subunit NuoN n=1 Tax=Azovibrio restrictus TaxID=146938 RepID=UPI0026F213BB|nr:NADH-quinone oxidoreductase subunit NuoN [Azovibrio restrictus]
MFNDFVAPSLYPAAPEIFLLTMACVILLLDLGVKSPRRTLTFVLTQLTLLGCAAITLATSNVEVVYTFSNMFVDDMLADFLKLLVYLTVSVVLFYSREYIQARQDVPKGEYFVLALLATLGMMVMISANHFLTLYLGLEMMSLCLYAMVALRRSSAVCTEAAMKYFILGALASGLLLYGMSMIYGATGSLEITAVAERLYTHTVDDKVLVFGIVFLVAGLAFKLGVVPFHMWVPDVYHGAPTSVTLFIGAAPKLAAFAIVMRLLVNGLITQAEDWQSMLIILSVLSMAIGNLVAIAQTNIKRMLAYSAISHMGFMLLGIVTGVVGGDARFALNAYSSALFYVVTYVLTTTAAFGLIMLFSKAGFESDELEDFKGLNKRSPWFAAMMMFVMLSMAGIPFFVGFFAKFSVLQAVVAAGYYWLAVVAVVLSLIGAFYYLRVVKFMYFDEPKHVEPIEGPTSLKVVLSVNGVAVGLLGLFPQMLMSLCAYTLLRSL